MRFINFLKKSFKNNMQEFISLSLHGRSLSKKIFKIKAIAIEKIT